MGKRKTDEEYLNEAKKAQGDKYEVLRVERHNKYVYIVAVCSKHSEFKLRIDHFRNIHGCKICRDDKIRQQGIDRRLIAKLDFPMKSKKVHNGKYKYFKDYKGAHKNMQIFCPTHGWFQQTPANHLSGEGCPKCKYEKLNALAHKRFLECKSLFINKAKKLHGDKYKYGEYYGCGIDMDIYCSKHGWFKQLPTKHLQGQGCPKCKRSHLETEISVFLNGENINYIEQASNKDLPWLELQRLDFYLPNYNIAIECQGKQHFVDGCNFGGNETLDMVIDRDKRKLQRCKENGIKLLYYSNLGINYPYQVYENKEELLEAILNNTN